MQENNFKGASKKIVMVVLLLIYFTSLFMF